MQRSASRVMPAAAAIVVRQRAEVVGKRRHGLAVEIAASRLVLIGLAVPMTAETQHADVHRAAAAHDRHVRRRVAVQKREALLDERALAIDRQVLREMKCAWCKFVDHVSPATAFTEITESPTFTEIAETARETPQSLRAVRVALRSTRSPAAPCADPARSYVTIPTVKRLVFAALALAAVLMPSRAMAHPVPFTYLDVHVDAGALTVTLIAHIADLANDLKIEPVEKPAEARGRQPARRDDDRDADAAILDRRGRPAVDRRRGRPLPEILTERQSLRFTLRYELPSPPGTLQIRALMFPYDPNHQTFLNVYEGEALTQAILDRGRPSFEYFAGTRQGVWAVIRKFVPAGVEPHPDRPRSSAVSRRPAAARRHRSAARAGRLVVHARPQPSRLSLAAFNIVSSPARIIEPAIALSIVYVGADNLLARGGRDMRAWIAFAFGFIHGLGFANVLREMDLPARALGWSLFSFNVGLEIGQLIVVAAVGVAARRGPIAQRERGPAGRVRRLAGRHGGRRVLVHPAGVFSGVA